jgi:ABC-type transport system substrate-binding protein
MRLRRTVPAVVAALCALSACSVAVGKVGHPPKAPAGAHRGGVLRVGITPPGGIDPLDAYEPVGKLISTAMCDTIVDIDPVTGQVREALARGWVNAGGNALTVKLRHGVRFSNGQVLTARDVNATLQQLIAPANGFYAGGLAKQFLPLGTSSKDTDLLADPTKSVDVIQSVNKFDFQVFTPIANGGALRTFAEPATAPVPRAAYDRDPAAFAHNPVCVGPYVLEAPFRAGDKQIRLKRSAHYYGENVGYTGGGVGYADEIVFTIYPNSTAALAAYQRGQVDVIQVPRAQVAGVRDTGSLVYGPATGVEYLGLPGATTGPFADPDVRLALSESIDRQQLAAKVFGPSAQVADSFEPPALAITAGPSLEGKKVKAAPLASCGDRTPAKPDLASARAHLAAAARQSGAKLLTGFTLEVNDDGPYPAMARELAAQWKAGLGLAVKVVTSPWTAYAAKSTGGTGFETAFRIRWTTDATSPVTTYNNEESYLGTLFGLQGSDGGNWARFSDRAFEFGLTEDAAGITDVAQRGFAFAKLSAILCDQLPLVPLVFDRPAFLVRSTKLAAARAVPVGRNGVLLLRELYLRS